MASEEYTRQQARRDRARRERERRALDRLLNSRQAYVEGRITQQVFSERVMHSSVTKSILVTAFFVQAYRERKETS